MKVHVEQAEGRNKILIFEGKKRELYLSFGLNGFGLTFEGKSYFFDIGVTFGRRDGDKDCKN